MAEPVVVRDSSGTAVCPEEPRHFTALGVGPPTHQPLIRTEPDLSTVQCHFSCPIADAGMRCCKDYAPSDHSPFWETGSRSRLSISKERDGWTGSGGSIIIAATASALQALIWLLAITLDELANGAISRA